jgi:hypothetical protein
MLSRWTWRFRITLNLTLLIIFGRSGAFIINSSQERSVVVNNYKGHDFEPFCQAERCSQHLFLTARTVRHYSGR